MEKIILKLIILILIATVHGGRKKHHSEEEEIDHGRRHHHESEVVDRVYPDVADVLDPNNDRYEFDLGNYENYVLVFGLNDSMSWSFTQFISSRLRDLSVIRTNSNYTYIDTSTPTQLEEWYQSDGLYRSYVVDKLTGTVYINCPVFNNTYNGYSYDIATNYYLHRIIHNVRKVKFVIVTSDKSLKETNYYKFKTLLRNVVKFVTRPEKYENSFSLVVTDVRKDGSGSGNIKTVVSTIRNTLKQVKTDLNRRNNLTYPTSYEYKYEKRKMIVIDSLLNTTSEPGKIAVVWHPTETNFTKSSIYRETKEFIRQVVDVNTEYTYVRNRNDFNFSVNFVPRYVPNLTDKLVNELVEEASDVFRVIRRQMLLWYDRIDDEYMYFNNVSYIVNVTREFSYSPEINELRYVGNPYNVLRLCDNITSYLNMSEYFCDDLNERLYQVLFVQTHVDQSVPLVPFQDVVDRFYYEMKGLERLTWFMLDLKYSLASYEVQRNRDYIRTVIEYPYYERNVTLESLVSHFEGFVPLYNASNYTDYKNNQVYVKYNFLREIERTVDFYVLYDRNVTCTEDLFLVQSTFLLASDVVDECKNAKEIKFNVLHTFYVDDDLVYENYNDRVFSIVAPRWSVVVDKTDDYRKIVVSGRRGRSGDDLYYDDVAYVGNTNYSTGYDGEDGLHGGVFIGVGYQFYNSSNLYIYANGGDGGSGQNGVNGQTGPNVEYPELSDEIMEIQPEHDSYNFDFNSYSDREYSLRNRVRNYADSKGYRYRFSVTTIDQVPYTRGVHYYKYEKVRFKYYYTLTRATDEVMVGYNGGDGGKGGSGGDRGVVKIFSSEPVPDFYGEYNEGRSGKGGQGGLGGLGGYSHSEITVVCDVVSTVVEVSHTESDNVVTTGKCYKQKIHYVPGFKFPSGVDGVDGMNGEITQWVNRTSYDHFIYHVFDYKRYLIQYFGDVRTMQLQDEFYRSMDENYEILKYYNNDYDFIVDIDNALVSLEPIDLDYINVTYDYTRVLRSALYKIHYLTDKTRGGNESERKLLKHWYGVVLTKLKLLTSSRFNYYVPDMVNYIPEMLDNINKIWNNPELKVRTINTSPWFVKSINRTLDTIDTMYTDYIMDELVRMRNEMTVNVSNLLQDIKVYKRIPDSPVVRVKQMKLDYVLWRLIQLQQVEYYMKLMKSVQSVNTNVFAMINEINDARAYNRKFNVSDLNSSAEYIKQFIVRSVHYTDDISTVGLFAYLDKLNTTLTEYYADTNEFKYDVFNITNKISKLVWYYNELDYKTRREYRADIFRLVYELRYRVKYESDSVDKERYIREFETVDVINKPAVFLMKHYDWFKFDADDCDYCREVFIRSIIRTSEQSIHYYNHTRYSMQRLHDSLYKMNNFINYIILMHSNNRYNWDNLNLQETYLYSTVRVFRQEITKFINEFNVDDVFPGLSMKVTELSKLNRIVYEQIHMYELRTYFSRLLTAVLSSADVSPTYKQLHNIIKRDLVNFEYSIIAKSFKMDVFPLASIYLNEVKSQMDLDSNEITEPEVVTRISIMKDKLMRVHNDIENFRDIYFTSSNFTYEYPVDYQRNYPPYHVWDCPSSVYSINKLLDGDTVTLNADIRFSNISLNSVTFSLIDFRFVTFKESVQKELNKVLKYFDIEVTHSGFSYYKCGCYDYYYTSGQSYVFRYSFERDSQGYPVRTNDNYRKMVEKTWRLSPYTLWSVRLIPTSDKVTFDDLTPFMNDVKIELSGWGSYLRDSFVDVCYRDLHLYYDRAETRVIGDVSFDLMQTDFKIIN